MLATISLLRAAQTPPTTRLEARIRPDTLWTSIFIDFSSIFRRFFTICSPLFLYFSLICTYESAQPVGSRVNARPAWFHKLGVTTKQRGNEIVSVRSDVLIVNSVLVWQAGDCLEEWQPPHHQHLQRTTEARWRDRSFAARWIYIYIYIYIYEENIYIFIIMIDNDYSSLRVTNYAW